MDILAKMFGGPAKVKVMRLFLLNKGQTFTNKEISERSRVARDKLRKEIRTLSSISFIKKSNKGWIFNRSFKYSKEVENLLVNADSFDFKEIAKNFRKLGQIKLLVFGGVLIDEKESRVDVLVVGNKLQKKKIENHIKKLEAEIGSELVYAIFDTKEFIYRLNMYDKLVRDILDFPHRVIVQSKSLPNQLLGNKH